MVSVFYVKFRYFFKNAPKPKKFVAKICRFILYFIEKSTFAAEEHFPQRKKPYFFHPAVCCCGLAQSLCTTQVSFRPQNRVLVLALQTGMNLTLYETEVSLLPTDVC